MSDDSDSDHVSVPIDTDAGPFSRNNTERKEAMIPQIARQAYPHRYVGRHEPTHDDFRDRKCGNQRYEVSTILYLLWSYILLCANVQTLVAVIFAEAAYLFCFYQGISFNMPVGLVSSSLVFPISFGISYTANRREAALKDLASIKASALALYYCSRNWTENDDLAAKFRENIFHLLRSMHEFLSHRGGHDKLLEVYTIFDELGLLCEDLRRHEEWVKSVVSRAYQYIRYMQCDFEKIRVVHDYRTIPALRAFGFVFLNLFGILLAPHFVFLASGNVYIGAYCTGFVSLMLINLYRVLYELEDPFEYNSVEDLRLDVLEEVDLHMWPLKGGKEA